MAVSTFRLLVAAVMLLVFFRPAVRTFTRGRWFNACIYGIAMAAMNQFYFAAYTVFAERVGKAEGGGLTDLAISITVAALVTLPIAASQLIDVSPNAWLVLTLAALIGVVIPYIADTVAARITSAQVVGTLFALDPVVGSILGWLFKGDQLTTRMLIVIPMVALAGAVITWRSSPRREAGGSVVRAQVQE